MWLCLEVGQGLEEEEVHVHEEDGLLTILKSKSFLKLTSGVRSVELRLPGKENSNSHGARPVHLIITMIPVGCQ